ncbi:hypothetical protein EPN16_01080 [bacterium]|nr:MAG: hypothetical protein EPN16_01080 [bacterium]
MSRNLCRVVLSGVIILSLASVAACQVEKAEHPAQESVVTAPAQESAPAAPMQEEGISWVWGEVKSVDGAASTLTVTYMDYQTNEEKDLSLTVDSQTEFEGVKDLSEIKPGNTSSIDYIVKDSKNIVRHISIEEMETMPEAPVSLEAAGEAKEEAAQEPLPELKAQ